MKRLLRDCTYRDPLTLATARLRAIQDGNAVLVAVYLPAGEDLYPCGFRGMLSELDALWAQGEALATRGGRELGTPPKPAEPARADTKGKVRP